MRQFVNVNKFRMDHTHDATSLYGAIQQTM